MKTNFRAGLTLLALAGASFTVRGADEWPDYRGPGLHQGQVEAKGLPTVWDETKNVTWKCPLPGKGWSSPVISGDEIWVTAAVGAEKPEADTPPSKDDYKSIKPDSGTIVSPVPLSFRAICVSLASGKITKNVEVYFIEKPGHIHNRNSYSSPSPILEEGKLYTHFGTYGTACVDTASGKVLWRNNGHKLEHSNGPGGSPALWKDKLLICCDGTDVQYMYALNKSDGKEAWKTPRSMPVNKGENMKKAYGTPFVFNNGGADQAVTPAADGLYAYNPNDGKELWRLKYNGFSNVARPVYDGKRLYFSTCFMRPEMWAIDPAGAAGDLPEAKVLWREKIQAACQSSPVLSDGRMYMYSDSGVARCLDSATAKEYWKQKLGFDGAASQIVADGKIYFFDGRDSAFVVKDSPEYTLISTNKLDDGFMASPAVVGKALIVRTKKSLYRIEEK